MEGELLPAVRSGLTGRQFLLFPIRQSMRKHLQKLNELQCVLQNTSEIHIANSTLDLLIEDLTKVCQQLKTSDNQSSMPMLQSIIAIARDTANITEKRLGADVHEKCEAIRLLLDSEDLSTDITLNNDRESESSISVYTDSDAKNDPKNLPPSLFKKRILSPIYKNRRNSDIQNIFPQNIKDEINDENVSKNLGSAHSNVSSKALNENLLKAVTLAYSNEEWKETLNPSRTKIEADNSQRGSLRSCRGPAKPTGHKKTRSRNYKDETTTSENESESETELDVLKTTTTISSRKTNNPPEDYYQKVHCVPPMYYPYPPLSNVSPIPMLKVPFSGVPAYHHMGHVQYEPHMMQWNRSNSKRTSPPTVKKARHNNPKELIDISDSDCLEIEDHKGQKNGREYASAVRDYLMRWLLRYRHNPYPSLRIKKKMSEMCGLNVKQIEDFLCNGNG